MSDAIWHVCLVSEQPLANALPALATYPHTVGAVLAATPTMNKRADWLAAVLSARRLGVERLALPNPHDLPAVRRVLEDWLDAQAGRALLLNATGGTKTLALQAVQAFVRRGLPVRYLDEAQGLWLDVVGDAPPQSLPAVKLRIDEVVALHGLRVKERRDELADAAWRAVAAGWARDALGSQAEWQTLKTMLSKKDGHLSNTAKGSLPRAVLQRLAQAGLARLQQGQWQVADERARGFLIGGWLENYALECARRAFKDDPAVQDMSSSVKVEEIDTAGELKKGQQQPDNELDVVLLRKGRLFVLECKNVNSGKTIPDILYKLAFQARVGGHSTRLALLHLGEASDAVRQRARLAGISLWGAQDLPRLPELLREWVQGKPARA